jgi:hypothetical protein
VTKWIGRGIGYVFEVAGLFITATGLVLLYVSLLGRIKFGEWPLNTLETLSNNLNAQWPGIGWVALSQREVNVLPPFISQQPLWLTFLALGAVVFAFGFLIVWTCNLILEAGIRKQEADAARQALIYAVASGLELGDGSLFGGET